jgi:acyl-CoA hydrolase
MLTAPELPKSRPVSYSAVREQAYMVFPNDLNSNDTVFGGLIMALMDRFSATAADRHAGGICATVGVDAVHFVAPAGRGDVLIFNSAVNRSFRTSMEVGCRVEAERRGGGVRRHLLSAYLTFVAMDEDSRPRPVPAIEAQTVIEQLRFEEAALRRRSRLAHAEELRALRERASREP